EIRHVAGAADGAITIEERVHAALHLARDAAEAAHRATDEPETHGVHRQVDRLAEATEAVDLRGPGRQVVDAEQPGVDIDQRAARAPARIHLVELFLAHRVIAGDADALELAARQRVRHGSRLAHHVAVAERVHAAIVAHQAGDGADALRALLVGDH